MNDEKINRDSLKLRQRLHDSFGLFCDMSLVSHLLSEMLREKQGEEIMGVFSSYSKEELLAAAEANAEFDKLGAEEPDNTLPEFTSLDMPPITVQERRKPGRPKKKKPDA